MLFDLKSKSGPILKWAGGKAGILPQLLPHFPTHFERYIEPFLGGGAAFFSLSSNLPALINDFNPELVGLYNVVRSHPLELMKALDKLFKQYSEDFYYALRSAKPTSPIDQAARMVFLNKTGFNGLYRQNSKGGFNVPFGKRPNCPALYSSENLMAANARLQQAQLTNTDFAEVLAQAGSGDFVYCDPPYEPLSPTSSFNAYTGGGFSQNEQRRLLEACEAAVLQGAQVAVSNSSAAFIVELYEGWKKNIIMAKRHINSKGQGRGAIEELLFLSPN